MSEVLQKVICIANEKYDGHFTLLKFTTNWKFCFGTLDDITPYSTPFMASGETMEAALEEGIKSDVNADEIFMRVEELE